MNKDIEKNPASIREFFINKGYIEDHPRFDWRGMHLDCARQFYFVEKIMEL